MASERQNPLELFLHGISLEGGMRAEVEALDEQRAWLNVLGSERRVRVRAAGLSVPYPSGLRRLMAAHPEVEVALVRRASPSFDRAAQEAGIGYLDVTGRGRIIASGFVYVVPPVSPAGMSRPRKDVEDEDAEDGWRAPAHNALRDVARPSRVSPFAPKASRVARAFLAEPRRAWRLSQLADACLMNPGNVHRVLQALVEQAFVERDGDDYVVRDPGSLLEAWAEGGSRSLSRSYFRLPVASDLGSSLAELLELMDGRAAVSGEFAAEKYAPHLAASQAILHCFDRGAWDAGRWHVRRGAPQLRPRWQILVGSADEGMAQFGQEREGFPLVSPAQLYVDMYRQNGRGREAAEHVRERVLGY